MPFRRTFGDQDNYYFTPLSPSRQIKKPLFQAILLAMPDLTPRLHACQPASLREALLAGAGIAGRSPSPEPALSKAEGRGGEKKKTAF